LLRGLARTDSAKIRTIIDNTNFLVRKITQKWISFIALRFGTYRDGREIMKTNFAVTSIIS